VDGTSRALDALDAHYFTKVTTKRTKEKKLNLRLNYIGTQRPMFGVVLQMQ